MKKNVARHYKAQHSRTILEVGCPELECGKKYTTYGNFEVHYKTKHLVTKKKAKAKKKKKEKIPTPLVKTRSRQKKTRLRQKRSYEIVDINEIVAENLPIDDNANNDENLVQPEDEAVQTPEADQTQAEQNNETEQQVDEVLEGCPCSPAQPIVEIMINEFAQDFWCLIK